MRKFFFMIVMMIALVGFAGVFINLDSFFGIGSAGKLLLDGEEKQIGMISNYGLQLSIDYGLHDGLRLGVTASSQNVSLAFESESLNFGLLCLGVEGLFAMDFFELVLQISAELHFVLTSFVYGEGKMNQNDFNGHIFSGKAVFEKYLSENLSVAVGGGMKYLSMESVNNSKSFKGYIPCVILRMGYSF